MIDELISQIEAKVGEEVLPKVQADLKKLQKAYSNVEADKAEAEESYKKVVAESMSRKKEIRDLKAQIVEKDGEIKELTENKGGDLEKLQADFEKLKAEKTELETFKAETEEKLKSEFEKRKTAFVSDFGKITSHKNFDAAKGKFKLPKPNDKGEYDFSKTEDADMEHNISKLAEYNDLGFFASDGKKTKPHNEMNKEPEPGAIDWTRVETGDDIKGAIRTIAQNQ